MYSEYRYTFDTAGSWSFDNETVTHVIIFNVDNSSSSHSGNRKNNLLMLGEGPNLGINGKFGGPEKKFSIDFTKANKKFGLCLYYNADNSYLFVNGKEIFKLKADNKNVNFPTRFCSWTVSDGISATEHRVVSLNENVHDFPVDYNSIEKCHIKHS